MAVDASRQGSVPMDSIPKFYHLKQESMKQAHAKNQHPSKQPPKRLIDGKSIPDNPPLYHVKCRQEIRLQRYLNQHHQFIYALEPCFTTINPFLTIDDLARLSSVCGILNNWVVAESVWKQACMAMTQYADLVRRHLRADTWYQLAISLYDDSFNPFRCYIPNMVGGCVNLLRECLLKLITSIRSKCIANPSIISLSNAPTTLFDTEWLFRCCVSLRNDRHGTVPQGLLPRLFQSILTEYCHSYAPLPVISKEQKDKNKKQSNINYNLQHLKANNRTICWLVSEWIIYQYIVDRLAMLTSKIDDHNYQYRFPKTMQLPPPHSSMHPHSHCNQRMLPFKSDIPCTKNKAIIREVSSCENCNGKSGRKIKKPHPLNVLINKIDGAGMSIHASVCSTTTTTTTTTTRTNNNGTHTTTTTITQSTQSPNMGDVPSSDAIPLGMGPLSNYESKKALIGPLNDQLQHLMKQNKAYKCKIMKQKRAIKGKKCLMNKIIFQNGKKKHRKSKKRKFKEKQMYNSFGSSSSENEIEEEGAPVITHTITRTMHSSSNGPSSHRHLMDKLQYDSDLDPEMFSNLMKMNESDNESIEKSDKNDVIRFKCTGCGQVHVKNVGEMEGNLEETSSETSSSESISIVDLTKDVSSSSNKSKCQCPACQIGLNKMPTMNGKKYIVSMNNRRKNGRNKKNNNKNKKSYFPNNQMNRTMLLNMNENGEKSVSVHLQLFGNYFLLYHDALCCEYWRKLAKDLEYENNHRLLGEAAIIFESIGMKSCPKRWCPLSLLNRPYYNFCKDKVTIYYKKSYFSLSCNAASLSPYIREFMGKNDHCIVDLSWVEGEKHHLKKLISFLEFHIVEPMPHIPTPVRSKKLARVVPKWYSDFAMQCDRKDCFIMILIGNGLAIAPLVHLFCARIATMIKSLKPQEVREIMALEEDVQKQKAIQLQKEQMQALQCKQ